MQRLPLHQGSRYFVNTMIKDFLLSISHYKQALQLTGQLKLWSYLLAPAIIAFIVAAGIFGSAWGLSDNIGNILPNFIPLALRNIAGFIIVFGSGLILFKQLVIALSAPFMSPLAEKVDRHLHGKSAPETPLSLNRMLGDLLRGLIIALRNVFRELALTALLLLLGLIPGMALLTTPLVFVVQAYYAGFGNMDYTLERYFRVNDSVRFVQSNRGIAIGNGSIFLLLLFSGIGFLLALPLGTIAATISTHQRMSQSS
jgi:CysZ protein